MYLPEAGKGKEKKKPPEKSGSSGGISFEL